MTEVPVVIFDWDGTLVDSIAAISDSLMGAGAEVGHLLTYDQAKHVIGLGLPTAAAVLLPTVSKEVHETFMASYKRRFLARAHEPQPFQDAKKVLDELRKQEICLAVATGKSRVGLDRALGFTGWHDYFKATRCADETRSKPHPLMIEEILHETQHQSAPVFMLGDTTHDLHLAHNAGVQAVGLTTGAHSRDELLSADPHFLGDSLESALMYILNSLK